MSKSLSKKLFYALRQKDTGQFVINVMWTSKGLPKIQFHKNIDFCSRPLHDLKLTLRYLINNNVNIEDLEIVTYTQTITRSQAKKSRIDFNNLVNTIEQDIMVDRLKT